MSLPTVGPFATTHGVDRWHDLSTRTQGDRVALIRCTCIYRPSEADERARTGSSITAACRDPQCPATAVHERSDRARATTGPVSG